MLNGVTFTDFLFSSVAYYWARPRELADRLTSEWERRREKPSISPLQAADGAPQEIVHKLLGLTDDCPVCAEFDAVWARIDAQFPGSHYHDSGLGILRGVWAATRHLSASTIVETGVARGFSSAVILSALAANGDGHLWSIDLPEVNLVRSGAAGSAVPPDLRGRWTWLKGGSRRLLPSLIDQHGPLDLFVHDSLHTRSNMLFEMRLAWDALRPGGLLLVDDIDHNSAFADFTTGLDVPWAVGGQGNRPGAFGAILKPGPPS